MAEAFREEPSSSEFHEDGSTNTISLLLLASRWQFDTYGLSTVNKSLVNNMRLVDPEVETIKITCAVVEEEGKISYIDVQDAAKCGVVLKGAKQPMSKKRHSRPELSWLDEYAGAYYRHLQIKNFDFIIGHAPYLANGCFNLKDICEERGALPKIILIFHGLPNDEDGDIDSNMVEKWLEAADIVFSVGKAVENELKHYIKAIDKDYRPIHKMYVPSYPLELFHMEREQVGEKIEGTQNITIMSGEVKDLKIAGLHFPLAVNATIGAAEHIRDFDGVRTNLTMLAAHKDDTGKWKAVSDKILKKENVERTGLSCHVETPTDINKLQSCLKKSTLFLLPLKSNATMFGTEALSAIAAGVPVLVSRYSGLAHLLQRIIEDEPVVYGSKLESATDTWRDKILERLLRPEESQKAANRLREQLLLDTSIAQTHLDFINIIARETSVQLQIDIKSDSAISQQHIDAAIKFGVEKVDALDVNKYVVAFLRKVLFQREKQDEHLLDNYLNREIEHKWQEVLSSLEDTNRKLMNIKSGSFIFTLFCPTRESLLQLQDETWKDEIQKRLTDLLKLLGAEVTVKLQTPEPVEIRHMRDPPAIRHKQRQKLKMPDSEKQSLGYETMTTATDLDLELPESDFKVKGWLSQQEEPDTTGLGGINTSIQLADTWAVDHVQPETKYLKASNRFVVSESGAIGISCGESPSLSVIYPDTVKPPVILSKNNTYRSATFIKINGKEYLAAAGDEDGCLYLWDVKSRTPKKVFDPNLPKDKLNKYMNICKIDDSTIRYLEACASLDGSRRVFILKMDKEELTLSSMLRLFTPNDIWDICYTEVEGGTPCFLLCVSYDNRIMAVEMVGGKTRWEVGKEQMGKKFKPQSICTDEDNCAYVAAVDPSKIHLLSVLDGTVIKQFDVRSYYDFINVFTVRFHDQHLYVERKIICSDEVQKYAIMKFKLIKEV